MSSLISDIKHHLVEAWEFVKARITEPDAPYPLSESDVDGLEEEIQTHRAQHELLKETRKLLRER